MKYHYHFVDLVLVRNLSTTYLLTVVGHVSIRLSVCKQVRCKPNQVVLIPNARVR